MAQCKLTPQEFIQNAFSPMIAVMCSPLVDQTCRKNNLSFIELLQPFCKLNAEAQIRDPSGAFFTIRNLRIIVMDVNYRPPQPTLARKFLNSSVALATDLRMTTLKVKDYALCVPPTIPWFEAWRETFLQVQFPSDHEFTKHFLACMFVVSSSEANPLDTLNHLLQNFNQLQSSTTQLKLPKWFSANILKYYVLLHDTVEGNDEIAVKTIDLLKQSYGAGNCFLLQMNSRPPGITDDQFLPDPWSQFLMRKAESSEAYDSESPHTPAESGSVISMPDNVSSDASSISRGNTTPTFNRSIGKLEVGQEANENASSIVTYHPLSPEIENRKVLGLDEDDNVNLPINANVWQGASPVPTIVHGACLTTEDIEQLKLLIHEFCIRSLFPYIENQIQLISEQISNKKGVSRSIFSATKRWFTPNKPGSASSTTAFNAVVYADDSSELQLRRLGDLYFMFGHYSMAFQAYYSAKRDFNADQAWLYYAGALEMAALSAFMCGEVTRKTCDYMEESIVTYLNTCRMPQFATRATLLSTECLKGKALYGEAAHQFIRMTSEDSDLRSALLLEQAAYAFLYNNKPSMIRKYAFHIVLAGHRFSKCGQRIHSLRCYRQAYQVYQGRDWSLAEDHIHYTIGRQAWYLKKLEEATEAFAKLLTPISKQNSTQQTIFLREYLNAHHLLRKNTDWHSMIIAELSLPQLDSNLTKVLLGPSPPLSTPGRIPASGISFSTDVDSELFQKWNKLEVMLVHEAHGSHPVVFKPMISLYTDKNSTGCKPIGVIGEPIQVLVSLYNSLQITLHLKNIHLLWKFTDEKKQTVTNDYSNDKNINEFVRTHTLEWINLLPNNKMELVVSVTPLAVGELLITGVCYTIVNTSSNESSVSVTGKQMFYITGPRYKTKMKDGNLQHTVDKRLDITIAPSAPCLQVSFSEISQELLANEIQNVSIEFRNIGSTALHKIMMASSVPHLFSLCSSKKTHLKKKLPSMPSKNPSDRERDLRKIHVIPIILPRNYHHHLEPGQTYTINIWLKAPSEKGIALVDLLFYYENIHGKCAPRYRLVRHVWHLSIQDSLESKVNACHSNTSKNVETLSLCIKSTNNNQLYHAVISEIQLLHAAIISDTWKLSDNINLPRYLKLHSQESINVVLKAYRSVNMMHKKRAVHYSKLLFYGKKCFSDEYELPCQDFARRSFLEEFNAFTNRIKENDVMNHNLEVMFILEWCALVTDSAGNKKSVIGQHHIPIKKILNSSKKEKNCTADFSFVNNLVEEIPLHADISALFTLEKQIVYTLVHPAKLQHDFNLRKLFIVPVKLILHNAVDNDLVVKIHTLGTSDSTTTVSSCKFELSSSSSSVNYRWMGRCEFVCSIKGFSSQELSLKAAFSTPGTYELGGRIEILCVQPIHPYETVMQSCKFNSAIIIHQKPVVK